MIVPVPPDLQPVLEQTPELKRAYLVGGCVRDALLGRPSLDVDVEVFGVTYEALAEALARWGRVDLVGRSFGTIKLGMSSGATVDFSVARRDSKVAPGHKGFAIVFDPTLEPRDAAARRDFTINAMMFDPRAGRVLDFFGGERDLHDHVLRHTSDAFAEDPLRVLRGMQIAARFDLAAAPETIEMARAIRAAHAELAVERVWGEWHKWGTRSVAPSKGLRFLEASGWLEHYPEIAALIGVPQDPEWHPEGDVYTHTLLALDALVTLDEWRAGDAAAHAVWSFAVLAHDFGKAGTTSTRQEDDGATHIVSHGHEAAGGPLAALFLARIDAPGVIRERVIPLVTNHLAHLQTESDRAVRRLATRLTPETIESLAVVIRADHAGRPPKPSTPPENLVRLLAKAAELRVRTEAPRPILLGRHLLERGQTPGPAMGVTLKAAFEAQLDGAFEDLSGALAWLGRQEGATSEA